MKFLMWLFFNDIYVRKKAVAVDNIFKYNDERRKDARCKHQLKMFIHRIKTKNICAFMGVWNFQVKLSGLKIWIEVLEWEYTS